MRRQEIRRARIDARLARVGAQLGVASHRGEKPRRAVRIESGARRDADADAVGFEFLRAREARQPDLRFRQRQRAGFRVAEHVVDDAVDQRGLLDLVLAHGGVLGDDVRHLVRQHGRKLGRVVGERDQPARHVELPARQRECIHRRRVEDDDVVAHVRPLGGGDELGDGLVEQRFEPLILVDAVIGRQDALVLALRSCRHLSLGLRRRIDRRRLGQGAEQHRTAARQQQRCDREPGECGRAPANRALRSISMCR